MHEDPEGGHMGDAPSDVGALEVGMEMGRVRYGWSKTMFDLKPASLSPIQTQNGKRAETNMRTRTH